jgi:hypothetical protein
MPWLPFILSGRQGRHICRRNRLGSPVSDPGSGQHLSDVRRRCRTGREGMAVFGRPVSAGRRLDGFPDMRKGYWPSRMPGPFSCQAGAWSGQNNCNRRSNPGGGATSVPWAGTAQARGRRTLGYSGQDAAEAGGETFLTRDRGDLTDLNAPGPTGCSESSQNWAEDA